MVKLAEVEEAIKTQSLNWQAKDHPLGEQVAYGNFKGFGFSFKKSEPKNTRNAVRNTGFTRGGAAPKEVDWRSKSGHNWITDVKDQGECGACVAFAVCASLEARVKIYSNSASKSIDLSEAELFFCGNTAEDSCEIGWTPGEALKRCRDTGVGYEKDFEYKDHQMACIRVNDRLKVDAYRQLENSDERKRAIASRGPVVAGMKVFSDFGYYSSGVYRPTTSDVSGLHAVCVVGYSDIEGCWIVKNSWGPSWGDEGFFKIGYGSCSIDSEFPFYEASPILAKSKEK